MIEQDTIKLLRECDAGAKMGISSIEDVLPSIRSDRLRQLLSESRAAHRQLAAEIQSRLERFRDEGKDPNLFAQTMSEMKTGVKLMADRTDHTVADLMTDGCNMGVKSLNRYLNQYSAADEFSKDIANRLINLEERLAIDLREFL